MKDTRNISNISLNWFFKLIFVILTVEDTFPYLYTVIFFFLNRFWWPEEEIFLWTLVWTRLFPTLRIQFFFFLSVRRENEKAQFIDKISTCKCVVNGWPAWFVWKLPAPESFVPPINHVTNFSRIAWFLIDKLTRPLNFRLNFLRFLCSFNKWVYLLLPKVYQKYPTSWYSFWENGRFLFNFHV